MPKFCRDPKRVGTDEQCDACWLAACEKAEAREESDDKAREEVG